MKGEWKKNVFEVVFTHIFNGVKFMNTSDLGLFSICDFLFFLHKFIFECILKDFMI